MAKSHGIYDSFTEQGLFWLPSHHLNKLSGFLYYDPERSTVLELLGMFGNPHDALKQASTNSRDNENFIIHGITTKGKPLSLLHALKTNQQIRIPGIPQETWRSNLLVIGAHINSADDDTIFRNSLFCFENIDHWLPHNSLTHRLDDKADTITIIAKHEQPVAFTSHEEFDITSSHNVKYNKHMTRAELDVTTHMVITSRAPQSLNWHLNRATRLQELASLCTGSFVPLTSFELHGPEIEYGEGSRFPSEVSVYSQLVNQERRAETKTKHYIPIVTGPELIRLNPHAVQLWFDQFEIIAPTLRLFFTITSEKTMFTNIRLLLAIHALEVFHRRTSRDTVMPEDEFTEFKKAMVSFIPPQIDRRMHEKLVSLYQFANEPSLKQRLTYVVSSLANDFNEKPAGFDKGFLQKLVDTRNYYTHFSEELRDRIFDGEGMHWATRRIILLLTMLLLRRIGIAAEDLKRLLHRHREFAHLWASADRPY